MIKATKRKHPSPRGTAAPPAAPIGGTSGERARPETRQDAATKKAGRSEELRFKVTEAVRERFKQGAKALGVKKGVFLEKLLAGWQGEQPGRMSAVASPSAKERARRRA
jgi:hypothetical protein